MYKKSISFSTLLLLSIFLISCTALRNNVDQDKNSPKISDDNDNSQEISTDFTIDSSNLDNTTISWFFTPNNEHRTPKVNPNLNFKLDDYDSIYNADTSKNSKNLYLTFDEGYENGYTSKILDTLKEKNVQAVFFVTSPYISSNPDLIKRMINENHVVGSHSNTHTSMPDKTSDIDSFNLEFIDVENKYKEVTGKEITKLFRPPMGEYSEKSLAMTKNLGYKSVFWSFAYDDWDPNKQPDQIYAKEKMINNLHDGSILLLHAVSQTNTEVLGDFIDSAKSLNYEFKLLSE